MTVIIGWIHFFLYTYTVVGFISREHLAQKLTEERPEDTAREGGFVLVDIAESEKFYDSHIPGSINIPEGEERTFERQFSRGKEIILYTSSERSEALIPTAEELVSRGFTRILIYEGGMDDWESGGEELERGEGAVFELPIAEKERE